MSLNRRYLSKGFSVRNSSGSSIPIGLAAVYGYDAGRNQVLVGPALADGDNDFGYIYIDRILDDGRTGRGYEVVLLESQDTSGGVAKAPIYLDPASEGAWTVTKPTTAGDDYQKLGRIVTVHATTGVVMIDLRGSQHALAPDELPASILANKPVSYAGAAFQGYVYFSGVTSDGDRITIGDEVCEFDTGAAVGAGATITVDVSGGASAAQSATALAAAINAAADIDFSAVAVSAMCVISALDVDDQSALVTTVDIGANIVAGQAALVNGEAPVLMPSQLVSYTVTAADVTAWAAGHGVPVAIFPGSAEPTLHSVQVWQDTAGSLAEVALTANSTFAWEELGNGYFALVASDAAAVFTAADEINVTVLAAR